MPTTPSHWFSRTVGFRSCCIWGLSVFAAIPCQADQPSPPSAAASTPVPSDIGPRQPVGPQASTTCSGITLNPGDNIQNTVSANGPNTVFCLNPGTYVQQSVRPRDGNQFIGRKGAVLDGQNKVQYFLNTAANNIVVKNLVITNYANPLQEGAINSTGANWLIQNNEISYNRGVGIKVNNGARVIANNIHHNHQMGYSAHGTNVLFDSNEIAFNNYLKEIDAGWEAGGGKAWDTQHLTMQYNYSHDNWGPGLWSDYNNIWTVYRYNKIENNGRAGIQHEISYNATIVGNLLQNDGLEGGNYCNWLWCSEIQIQNSGGIEGGRYAGNIEISGNTIKPNQQGKGITLLQQNRGNGDRYGAVPRAVQNVNVHNNTTDVSNGGVTGAVQDGTDNGIYSSRNNRFDYNTYILGNNANPFTWSNKWGGISFWQSFGLDLNGTFK